MASQNDKIKASSAIQYAKHAEHLSLEHHGSQEEGPNPTTAIEAKFLTPLDPVIQTADGGRLPTVPIDQALKLNTLRADVDGTGSKAGKYEKQARKLEEDSSRHSPGGSSSFSDGQSQATQAEAPLGTSVPYPRTHPLFPPLPLYGPPSFLRDLHSFTFRCSSACLSLAFLSIIVLGSAFTSIPLALKHIWLRITFRDPNARRPFYEEEKKRRKERQEAAKAWKRQRRRRRGRPGSDKSKEEEGKNADPCEPTEGGRDPLVCDVGYYARRVGLDVEEYKVQTEDGFVIVLWHLFNPREQQPASPDRRAHGAPDIFQNGDSVQDTDSLTSQTSTRKCKYPILLIHGLLQSAGAYCTNDDHSLAFFLCKSGFDVWLGNNRCGFSPHHTLLKYNDPRMWAWNIRQMGVMDLPAFISRVLAETGFSKLGLVAHSQGTTETFVALAKEQRPDIGNRISVFCALAPAVYAGPLIGKAYLKFMRIISPALFRMVFGIHAFIPFMMTMHALLPGRLYGAMGYRVFSFLFNWTDDRWDQGLRDRLFQFSPVYVSAESMRWWLGRECFATQKCILATREEWQQEDEEDEAENSDENSTGLSTEHMLPKTAGKKTNSDRGRHAWYDEQVPPFALWVAGSDQLVDGRRLLRRFERGREPHVRVVHSKVIEDYEHLDVLWAVDVIETVGNELREVIWGSVPRQTRDRCHIPLGCEEVGPWN